MNDELINDDLISLAGNNQIEIATVFSTLALYNDDHTKLYFASDYDEDDGTVSLYCADLKTAAKTGDASDSVIKIRVRGQCGRRL